MLEQARKRFKEKSVENKNIKLIQGDVGELPFRDETFEIVLSMNGVPAFPDKEKSYREIHRVLKKEGRVFAYFYIQNESKITDILVKKILIKKGWFTPPFETAVSLKLKLEKDYTIEHFRVYGAKVCFIARKKN